jgi:predicted DNA-binding protein (MmcQ/YjbR family)
VSRRAEPGGAAALTAFVTLRRVCASRPQAQASRKWGNVDTFVVHRKMFAIFVLDARGRSSDVWFKVDAVRFLELTDRPGIRPAPYLARAGWVAIADPSRFAATELCPLIERSYRLVVAGLAQRVQRELGFEPMPRPAARTPRLVRSAGPDAPRPRRPSPGRRPAPGRAPDDD